MMASATESLLHWADVVVIVAYFVVVLAVGIWSSRQSTRSGSISSYFLAGRSMNFALVGASLFVSNIGSGHFIGLAGSGAQSGIGIGAYELNAVFIILVLGWVFMPVYMASGVYTMPEYLQRRYGGQRIRIYLSLLTLLLYVTTKISADLYAGAIFIEQSLRWNLYVSVIVLLIIAAIFTIAGGLNAVIWTDFVQCGIMLAGSLTLLVVVLVKVGGYASLVERFPMARAKVSSENVSDCSEVPKDFLHLIRGIHDPELPWPGVLFGLSVSSIWYWCTDQVIVQRALASKNYSHAKAACVVAGYLKLLPMFLMVLPGMAARVLFPDEVGCAEPDSCEKYCGSRQGCSNIAYPKLVIELMPAGLRGLMLAVMLAALMSSLTSIFNSSSTIFTIDVWKTFRPKTSETHLVIVGRIFTAVMILISLLWVPILKSSKGSQLQHYIQSITSYLAPPIAAAYILGLLTHRANEKGAFSGLVVGLVIGMGRFILEFFVYPAVLCGEPDLRPSIVKDVHYLHFGLLLFVFCVIFMMIISALTDPVSQQRLYRLTYYLRYNVQERLSSEGADGKIELEFATEEDPSSQAAQADSTLTRNLKRICCISGNAVLNGAVMSSAEMQIMENRMISLAENQCMKRSTRWAAMALMGICIFLWGFYA